MRGLIRKSQKGQTAVEYILMMAVATTIGLTAFKKLNEYLLTNPNSFISKSLRIYSDKMDKDSGYKRFPFRVSR